MSMIKNEDILGYSIGEEVCCEECINKEEERDLTQEDIITQDYAEKEESLIFCDRCKKRII